MLETHQNQGNKKIAAILVTLLVVVGMVAFIDHLNKSDSGDLATTSGGTTTDMSTPTATATQGADSTSTSASSSSSTSSSASSSAYKDGTYTASADYYVPHGYEDIKVTLTIANGTVTSASIVNSEGDHESADFQEHFAAAYKSYVVGKAVDSISLSRVSGASDTTDGFNDALKQIEQQAQA